MVEKESVIKLEEMNKPSCKLLLTTPMAAIMVSGTSQGKWSGMLESIGPIYAAAAKKTHGEIQDALMTASFLLQGGEKAIGEFFTGEDSTFEHMMDVSATGADVWMCKLSDGEIKSKDLVRLFQAIQSGLIKAVGDFRDENEMIGQLIEVQDKVIEHISSLN